MITVIPDVVSKDELAQLRDGLDAATFADGARSAGWNAAGIKNNQQLTPGMPGYDPLRQIVQSGLDRNPLFQTAVRPRFVQPVMFNRYAPGMSYGAHMDDAIMKTVTAYPGRVRIDVSFTLFLTDPASYQGGELVVDLGGVEQGFKLPAGALVAYPATTLHRVAPVTEGVRTAAVGWVQSEIRDPAQRAILFDLERARRTVFAAAGKNETFDLLSRVLGNLIHMWAEL